MTHVLRQRNQVAPLLVALSVVVVSCGGRVEGTGVDGPSSGGTRGEGGGSSAGVGGQVGEPDAGSGEAGDLPEWCPPALVSYDHYGRRILRQTTCGDVHPSGPLIFVSEVSSGAIFGEWFDDPRFECDAPTVDNEGCRVEVHCPISIHGRRIADLGVDVGGFRGRGSLVVHDADSGCEATFSVDVELRQSGDPPDRRSADR